MGRSKRMKIVFEDLSRTHHWLQGEDNILSTENMRKEEATTAKAVKDFGKEHRQKSVQKKAAASQRNRQHHSPSTAS